MPSDDRPDARRAASTRGRARAETSGSGPAASGRAASTRSATHVNVRTGRVRKPPARWHGLDVARGLAVGLATTLVVGAVLAPRTLGPVAWWGLSPVDLVPGVFLVVAGAGAGWRHDHEVAWTTRRRWRRTGVLVAAGVAVAVARAGGEPARLAAEELLRLGAATGIAAVALRLPRWVLAPAAVMFALVPGAVVAGDPLGRGLSGVDPARGWALEALVGLPTGGVPIVSLPGAVALVLLGHAFGVWARRRPPGPATGAAVATVGLWCFVAMVGAAQVSAPVPAILSLSASLAAAGLGAIVLACGQLAAVLGEGGDGAGSTAGSRAGSRAGCRAGSGAGSGGGGRSRSGAGAGSRSRRASGPMGAPGLAAVGRVALPLVVLGTVAVALVDVDVLPELPALSAVTAGGLLAAAAIPVARVLDRWPLRA